MRPGGAWPPYPDNPTNFIICTCCQASSRSPPLKWIQMDCQNSMQSEDGAGEGGSWTELWLCPVLTTPQLAMLHHWRAFCSTWAYPLFFPFRSSIYSVSPSICDRGVQNSHSFQAFFPKICHTDRILVLSLALLLILQRAPSSMVHSRSFLGQQGSHHVVSPHYPDLASYSRYRGTVFQLVCLALCLSVSYRLLQEVSVPPCKSSNSAESAFLQTWDQYCKS